MHKIILFSLMAFGLSIASQGGLESAEQTQRAEGYKASYLKKSPRIDGDHADWPKIELIDLYNERLADVRARVKLAWDRNYLYIAAHVTDKKQVNDKEPAKVQDADAFILELCTRMEDQKEQEGIFDYTLTVSPTSQSGKPVLKLVNKTTGFNVITEDGKTKSKLRWAVTGDKDWFVEAAIPFKLLNLKPKPDMKLPFLIVVFDRDRDDIDEWAGSFHTRVESFNKKKPINERPYISLENALVSPKRAEVQKKTKPTSGGLVQVSHIEPANVISLGNHVTYTGSMRAPVAGEGDIKIEVIDYFKKAVFTNEFTRTYKKDEAFGLPLDFGVLPTGYYEIHISWNFKVGDEVVSGKETALTFGVAPEITRTAKDTRDQGYRMGLKMWYLGKAWWRNNAEWDEDEIVTATTKMGLQWTRALMQQEGFLATESLIKDYPMNVIMKVESYPQELFDKERYGSIEEWEKINGRGWQKKTVPLEHGYKEYIRTVLKTIPKEQNVFEIWNEAWDKMTAEDLATISNWVAEVILEERPDAIIGPNLMGRPSKYGYDAEYIRAGGMKGMKMVALHPYSGAEDRQWMRDYKLWLKEQLGRDIAIYITEYGDHSCPEGPSKNSEESQAQSVVRQSLALYAEGVVAMTPHTMGQREEIRNYHEHWFGSFRLNHQPKPVFMALANCARMIDSKAYVGDLWFGTGIGAMVFEKNGEYTLALWTKDGEQSIEFDPQVKELVLVDMVGHETKLTLTGGKQKFTVSKDVSYLVGINPEIAKQATQELNPDRWPKPDADLKITRVAPEFKAVLVADGKFEEWKNAKQLEMIDRKVNGKDASGVGYVSWDKEYLYVGVDMRDNQVFNEQVKGMIYRDDSVELFISTEMRTDNPGFGPNDFQFMASPTSKNAEPIVGQIVNRETHEVGLVKDGQHFIGKTDKGWAFEFAIPWRMLNGFKAESGKKIAFDLRVNDSDTTHKRWKIDPVDVGRVMPQNSERWSILELE